MKVLITQTQEIINLLQTEVLTEAAEIEGDTRLFSSGLLDSIQLTSLLISLEKRYQVSIGPFDVSQENFDTPEQIVQWLNQSK